MKTTQLLMTITLAAATSTSLVAGPFHHGPRDHVGPRGDGGDGRADAMHEEAILDKTDTHGPLFIKWDRDQRPADLLVYHEMTYKRIVSLLEAGALSESEGSAAKKEHERISAILRGYQEGGLTTEERIDGRGMLDALNDHINGVAREPEKDDARSPLLNFKEHAIEERIEFGERSGRLSTGEASRLRRDLASVVKIEARLKENGLTTRERERLHEEADELIRQLHHDLLD